MKKKSHRPHCQLAIKWRGEARRKLPDVSRKVDLKGAKSEEDYFSIQLPEKGTQHSIIQPMTFIQGELSIK